MRNLFRMLRGKPVVLSPKQEEKMARARAKADAQIAKGEADAAKARLQYEAFMASQGLEIQPAPTQSTNVRDLFKQSFEQLRETVEHTFDDRRGVLDPGPGADLNHPPEEQEDPGRRAEIAAAERAARETTRAPFKASDPLHIALTRIATTGREQLADVERVLRTLDPADVYGVYRVPERYDISKGGGEGNRYLEWEIVHRPGSPVTSDLFTAAFRRDSHWVQRRSGELGVLDEDVSGALVAHARIEPEDCFGLSRLLQLRGIASDDSTSYKSHIEGAVLFSRTDVSQAHRELMAQAPLAQLPAAPFYLEILDWEAVAAWVAPYRYGPPRTPSPLPHLPSDPRELLTAYLEIVGVRSEDSYGVQIARTSENLIGDLSSASFRRNLGRKPKLPCADGEERQRLIAPDQIVLAYRDRPDYAEGRGRWRAYQHEVLRARLDHLTGVRPLIEVEDYPRPSFLSEVFDMVNPLDPLQAFPQLFNRNERPSLGPYCGSLP